jgi:type II secretory pathway component PulF
LNKHPVDETIGLVDGDDDLPIAGQISRAIGAGLPLESGLRALAEQTRSRRTKRALLDLSNRLEAGTPLMNALRESSADLPRSMRALVEAGMETGRLDAVMQYSIDQAQRATWLRQSIWLSLAYPLFLIWLGTCICAFILLQIIPQFKQIFEDFGTELPGLTLAVLGVSSMFKHVGWSPALAFIPIMIVMTMLGQVSFIKRRLSSIPVFGAVFRFAALSDFCQVLALLLESRLPFPKAVRCAANASDDLWLIRRCEEFSLDLDNGEPADQAARVAGLPNALIQVFRHASSDRTVIDALRSLSELFAARCSVSTRLLTAVLEPFAVVIVLSFGAITAVAVFLPLIKLLNDLS